MSRKKIAIIGCGGIGKRHCQAYEKIPNAELVCYVDTDIEKANGFLKLFGGQAAYSDISEIDPSKIDLISVTTPPMFHTEPVKKALEMGLNVFCEKPLAMNTKDIVELKRLAEQKNKVIGIGFKMRFEPVFIHAKKKIKEIGEIIGVSIVKIQPYNKRPGFDWVPRVGAMYELSVHDYDLVSYISGLKPLNVMAKVGYDEGWNREKRAFLDVEYSNGVTGQLMSVYSEGAKFHYRDLTMTFVGEKGYMRIERPDRIVLHSGDVSKILVDPQDPLEPFIKELKSFIDGMDAGDIGECANLEDALFCTALVECANESSKSASRINIKIS